MSKYERIIERLKHELATEYDMSEYYSGKCKDIEKRVIELKEAIAELESINASRNIS